MRTSLDALWEKTQDPHPHQRWDLRFSTISYLPKDSDDPRGDAQPQRFAYQTRIAFGVAILGGGESTGENNGPQERTSALRFWSADWKSLIAEGSGYWKYKQQGDHVLFFTWYDYRTRFGLAGRTLDGLCFRPLMGWATAWSFDRLRLWIEQETPPEQVLRWSILFTLARLVLCAVWIWHGIVPKLLFPQDQESSLLAAQGIGRQWLPLFGALEVAFGLSGLILWRWLGFFLCTAAAMVLALVSVASTSPDVLTRAFNPVTLNLAVAALAVAGWMAAPWTAFAGRCRRHPNQSVAAGDTLACPPSTS